MKSLQDYIDKYKEIANNLEIAGDSVDALIQMLAQFSFMSEMESINYANESSLERSTLVNSKIQHCVDRMYSVFRGSCPRVKLRFTPFRYLKLKKYELVYSSGNINLYYDGDPITIAPSSSSKNYVTITCILAKTIKTSTKVLSESNRYYVDIDDTNLSNDGYVTVNDEIIPMYRRFSDHIKYGGIFDLTLPDYGMRLYAPDIFRTKNEIDSMNSSEELPFPNTSIVSNMFEFCKLSDFSGLDKIKVEGTEFPTSIEKLDSETYPGITLINEVPRDTVTSIHYKANRDRYVNSIIRSNLDVGSMLEEEFSDKVIKEGTTYEFTTNRTEDDINPELTIYYIPYSEDNLITEEDRISFMNKNRSYYVTENINIVKGTKCTVQFNINVELYQNIRIDDEVSTILKQYEDKFNIDLESKLGEIETAIGKISNVRSIPRIKDGDLLKSGVEFNEINDDGNKIQYTPDKIKYCKIEFNILSTIYKRML